MVTISFDRTIKQILVEAPDTEVTVQEVYDACRVYESNVYELDDRQLISAGGKEGLGGGNTVAITASLLNGWLLSFAARAGPAEIACFVTGGNLVREDPVTGTVASSDAGTTLTDSTQSFLIRGVREDDVLTNDTDGSTATVISVDSDTSITHTALSGGSENDWDIGESYTIQATSPICPTAFTQVVIAQSSAPVSIATATADFVTALLETLVDGTTFSEILRDLLAMASGRIVESPAGTFTFYDRDNATTRYTLVRSGSERTRS